jgi:hypothetical protein
LNEKIQQIIFYARHDVGSLIKFFTIVVHAMEVLLSKIQTQNGWFVVAESLLMF